MWRHRRKIGHLMSYSPQVAADCAMASLEAYNDSPFVEGYDTTHTFEDGDTFAFICERERHAILAYRGTESITDFLTDIKYVKTDWHYGRVHKGFAEAFRPTHEAIQAALVGKAYYVTGHSLGGALATLEASYGNAMACYVYGCPRVGNRKFKVHIPLHRHEKFGDMVTIIPPRQSFMQSFYALTHGRWPTLYQHKGTEIPVPGFMHSAAGYVEGTARLNN